MAHRQYRDEADVLWQVWDIHPMEVSQQLSQERDLGDTPTTTTHMAVSGELAGGWLCFESAREKRRLWPIPAGWERLTDAELTRLCDAAVNARARRAARPNG